MARKENPIIVESVEFDYVGTDEQLILSEKYNQRLPYGK